MREIADLFRSVVLFSLGAALVVAEVRAVPVRRGVLALAVVLFVAIVADLAAHLAAHERRRPLRPYARRNPLERRLSDETPSSGTTTAETDAT